VVHLAGMPADMDPIMALAAERDFFVIEDCAQAHGARYKGRSVGSIGHIGAWSFCQDKIMTTGGEGGMVTTNDKTLWQAMWSYKDHGKSYDAVYHKQHAPGFRWVHDSFGTNWRMMEMQAVIGRIQLKRMTDWTAARIANAAKLDAVAAQYPLIRRVAIPTDMVHAEYKHYFFVNSDLLADDWTRDRIIDEINMRGVPCYHGSCSEVYLEKAFDDTPWRPVASLPHAKLLGETSIMMLVHPTLSAFELAISCKVMAEVFSLASR
jgi:dTDP-4-amino-4,6-dideoxygalactose transaminase